MSKVLDDLRAAEQSRQALRPAEEFSGGMTLDAVRVAEAEALRRAGTDERLRRDADNRRQVDSDLMLAVKRKQAAEELALQQAQKRAQAEAAAETAAASRAHAERLLEMAARARVEAEERALADTLRRELAVSDLAKAAQARASREQDAERMARERAASERRAAELALEKTRAEQALEALTLARAAAEVDATRQAERHAVEQAAADQASEARERVEMQARHPGGLVSAMTASVEMRRRAPVNPVPVLAHGAPLPKLGQADSQSPFWRHPRWWAGIVAGTVVGALLVALVFPGMGAYTGRSASLTPILKLDMGAPDWTQRR